MAEMHMKTMSKVPRKSDPDWNPTMEESVGGGGGKVITMGTKMASGIPRKRKIQNTESDSAFLNPLRMMSFAQLILSLSRQNGLLYTHAGEGGSEVKGNKETKFMQRNKEVPRLDREHRLGRIVLMFPRIAGTRAPHNQSM